MKLKEQISVVSGEARGEINVCMDREPGCLEIKVVNNFESICGLRREWDKSVERLNGTVYMTFDWLQTWWEFYGAGSELRIFLFREEGALAALLPMYMEQFGLGPISLRVARLVGANVPPKTFDPPVDPAHAGQVFHLMMEHLFSVEKCDLLSFGPVSKLWKGKEAFQSVCQRMRQEGHGADYHARDVQNVFQLPSTFEEYLQQLDSGERKNRLKRIRQLEKHARMSEDIVAEPELVKKEFERFVEMHSKQWHEMGKGGHFGAWPGALEFNRALVAKQAEKGRVRFFRLLADGEVIASRYTYTFGGVLFSELPARATGQIWTKLGIGVTSLIKFKGQAIKEGISFVDSGLGAYEHKSAAGGEEIEVGVWRVTGRVAASRLKSRAGLAVSRAILFLFRKVWHRRVLPMLPSRIRRSQSMKWLRFDY